MEQRGEDEALLARIARADRSALEQLYRRNAPWLTSRLQTRCADEDLVDIAVQDTFVAVWNKPGSYRGEGAVAAWLWGIAIRRLIDQLRRKRPVPVAPESITAGAVSFEERFLASGAHGELPQDVAFTAGSRVHDVVDYLAVLKGIDDDRHRRRWVFHVLDLVALRDQVADDVGTLSGGMKKRLALAQALLGQPSLILLDEPVAGVDPDERIRIRDLITANRSGATVVVSTHLTEEAAIADSIVVLDAGRVRFVGRPADLTAVAGGRTWVQDTRPSGSVRASWLQADGRYRCLGHAGASPEGDMVAPTLEDGYLALISAPAVGERVTPP